MSVMAPAARFLATSSISTAGSTPGARVGVAVVAVGVGAERQSGDDPASQREMDFAEKHLDPGDSTGLGGEVRAVGPVQAGRAGRAVEPIFRQPAT